MSQSSIPVIRTAWTTVASNRTVGASRRRTPAIWSSPLVFAALLVSAVGLAILVSMLIDLQWQSRMLAAQVRQLEHQGLELSSEVSEARHAETYYNSVLAGTRRVLEQSREKSWTPLLRSIVRATSSGIALQRVRINEEPEGSGEYAVEVAGVAGGEQPGAVADAFLSRLRADIAPRFQVLEDVRFQSLNSLAGTPGNCVEFFIVTRFGLRPAVPAQIQP